MLGQVGTGERLTDAVVADVGDLAQALEEAERLQDAGIDADADVGVPGFDPLQSRARSEGALGYHRHRQPSASTGIMNVSPKLAQHAPHRSRRVVWSGHYVTFALQIGALCSTKTTFHLALEASSQWRTKFY